MTVQLVKNDAAAPGLEPGFHAYEIRDEKGNLVGVVAAGPSSLGTMWTAARLSPNRRLLFGAPMVVERSRKAAVAALLEAIR